MFHIYMEEKWKQIARSVIVTFHFQYEHAELTFKKIRGWPYKPLMHSICGTSIVIIICFTTQTCMHLVAAAIFNEPAPLHTNGKMKFPGNHPLLKNSTRTREEFVQLVNKARCKEHYFKLDLPRICSYATSTFILEDGTS